MKEWTIFVLIRLKFTFDGTTLANLSLALLINVCVLAPGSNLQGEIESGTLLIRSAPIYQQCIRSSSFWLEHLSPHSLDYLCILETNFVYLDKIHSGQMNQTCKILSKLFD